jgi:hypothetical protein
MDVEHYNDGIKQTKLSSYRMKLNQTEQNNSQMEQNCNQTKQTTIRRNGIVIGQNGNEYCTEPNYHRTNIDSKMSIMMSTEHHSITLIVTSVRNSCTPST